MNFSRLIASVLVLLAAMALSSITLVSGHSELVATSRSALHSQRHLLTRSHRALLQVCPDKSHCIHEVC